MTAPRHHDACPFVGRAVLPCVTCAALAKAEATWNECSALTERMAFDRGRDLAAKAAHDEAARRGLPVDVCAAVLAAAKGAA